MNTFEDKLLAELRTVVAERPVDIRRKRPKRVLVGIAACLTLAAGTAVAVPMLSGDPAYAVVTQPDGSVRVTIYRAEGDKGLQKRLRAAGVPAEVDFLAKGKTCRRTPAGKPPGDADSRLTVLHEGPNGQVTVLVLWPNDYRSRGRTLLLEGEGSGEQWLTKVSTLKTGTFGRCTPVDSPWLPLKPQR
ncbi:hypothetical protein E1263_16760 [Kribbella antibiotica]|uniref:Uncharacterized protein n=1 Tax=Kribbella antibiotica TaxID=190195 RepID=A0A4R4ZMW0_9ACTN|nr:hypothetical protein [Kribbella antibiotica]TDD59049.1 hypothetical protein E1263_16760 [Kribbella antibiotica]